MYEVRKATEDELSIVVGAMGSVGNITHEHTWGFWDKDKCFGGVQLYNTKDVLSKDNFAITITAKPDFRLGLMLYRTITMVLATKGRVCAKVAITNKESRKGARHLGFRPLYVEDGYEYLEISKVPDRMQARWGKHV